MWEYRTIEIKEVSSWMGGKFDVPVLDKTLNDMGNEGWELVNVIPSNKSYGQTGRLLAIFKRERRF